MIKKILLGLSGSRCASAAVRCAVDLGRRHDASVTGLSIVDVHRVEEVLIPDSLRHSPLAHHIVDRPLEEVRKRALAALAEFEGAAQEAGIRWETHRETGEPFETLVSRWRYHDVTVLSLRGFFDYGVVPEAHDALFRLYENGVRPLIAVAPEPREIRRALIAYHGSLGAAKAMKRFVQMRLWPDLEVHLACFDKPSSEAEPLLRDAAEYCRAHGYESRTHSAAGPARKNLLPLAAELNADLLVLGSSPHALWTRKILGDTLLHTIRESARPLFLSH